MSRTLCPRVAALIIPLVTFATSRADEPPAGPNPDRALVMLREGNARFVAGTEQHLNASAARRAEVASGQNPFAILLSCADSRVPVERLFDRGIGDLFVVRVAGNVSDTDEIGTIEYGVGHLGAPLVVVMGHTGCGAVKAVASGAEFHGSIPGLVDNIIPAVEWVKKNRPELTGEELINAAIEANVWQSIDDLISTSLEVRTKLTAGKVKIVGAVYDLASGRVRWLGEHPYQGTIILSADRKSQASAVHANVPRAQETPHASAQPGEAAPAQAAHEPEPPAEEKSAKAEAEHDGTDHADPHR